MRHLRLFIGMVVTAGLIGILAVWPTYADPPYEPPGLARALAAQALHTEALLGIEGVVGTATGLGEDGNPAILVFTERPGIAGIPGAVDGVPVVVKVTGKFFALHHCKGAHASDPACDGGGEGGGGGDSGGSSEPSTTDEWPRPVPIGISTGNYAECSAGTIGARLTKGSDVYALSNNHVYALENQADIGSEILQPGRYDSGCNLELEDKIAELFDFEPIRFNCSCFIFCSCDSTKDNMIDAAVAVSLETNLGNSTPSDGYGTPKSQTVTAVLDQNVQKYGRTTLLTRGKVTGINATVIVGYNSGYARFVNQIIVESNKSFIKAGDSGSLLVTYPDRLTVGLLFAGNSSGKMAIANPIGEVLSRFGMTIDGEQ